MTDAAAAGSAFGPLLVIGLCLMAAGVLLLYLFRRGAGRRGWVDSDTV